MGRKQKPYTHEIRMGGLFRWVVDGDQEHNSSFLIFKFGRHERCAYFHILSQSYGDGFFNLSDVIITLSLKIRESKTDSTYVKSSKNSMAEKASLVYKKSFKLYKKTKKQMNSILKIRRILESKNYFKRPLLAFYHEVLEI